MRPLANSKDYKIGVELLRCCLGGVTLGISAPLTLHKDLTPVQNKMEDFCSDGSLNLRLNIIMPMPSAKKHGKSHAKDLPPNFILKAVQREPSAFKREQFLKAAPHLELLMSDPVMGDQTKQLFLWDDKVSFVPLMSGFMLVANGCKEALLLLDKEWHVDRSNMSSSWWPLANITTINAAMAFLAIYLAERGDGLIVHGTGLSSQDEGYLFLASSGGGKTALSMQSPPGAVLADDGIIIRESGKHYRIYPTPFRQRPGGETIRWAWHQSAETLRAMFILDKGTATRLRPISRPQALGVLINAFTHFYMWMKPQQAVKVFDFWRRLSTTIPIAGLEWRLGSDFWPEIYNLLNHGNKNETKKRVSTMA